jgi:hypothetical protein
MGRERTHRLFGGFFGLGRRTLPEARPSVRLGGRRDAPLGGMNGLKRRTVADARFVGGMRPVVEGQERADEARRR